MLIPLISVLLCALVVCSSLPSIGNGHYSMNINMPNVSPQNHDVSICTAKKLDSLESYIVQYEPDADARTAHHMLLFGCSGIHSHDNLFPSSWNCGGELCNGMKIMYGWGRNAPALKLPQNVGFLVGGNSSIQYLVLQVHYAKPLLGRTDNSGLKLYITTEKQSYVVGIHLLMAHNVRIPPHMPKYHVDINCKFPGNEPIYVFAYRVHTHKLGRVVSGYKCSMSDGSCSLLAKGNPQWPQAYYPIYETQKLAANDILAARCTYNSTLENGYTSIGSSASDEMCNVYLMYYTENRNRALSDLQPCVDVEFPNRIQDLPPGNDEPLSGLRKSQIPMTSGNIDLGNYNNIANKINTDAFDVQASPYFNNPVPTSHSDENLLPKRIPTNKYQDQTDIPSPEYMYRTVSKWPTKGEEFGQISAVAINSKGNIVIFHRGQHIWNALTFNPYNNYAGDRKSPISMPTVLIIDPVSGKVIERWGRNLFFMPHGLSFDHEGRYWITDVALHQIFCFHSSGAEEPILTLGERFVNGNDREHFCKPTSVAVAKSGEFYVADGYCNSRIIRFSSSGSFLNQWGEPSSMLQPHPPIATFSVPHKVVLLEDRNLVCVADRENGRIQCFTEEKGDFRFEIQKEEFSGEIYSIAYAKDKGLLFAVSGQAVLNEHPVKAFVFNITDQKMLNIFTPETGAFGKPHDIAVTHDGEEAYVCEIGPNIVWKFVREYHKSRKKVLVDVDGHTVVSPSSGPSMMGHVQTIVSQEDGNKKVVDNDESFATSMIVMAFIGIPVLIVVLVTAIMRLRKRGKLQICNVGHVKGWLGGYRTPHPQEKFNLGTLLNPHKGFDKVSIEESDGDDAVSESENEEFSTSTKKA